MLQKWHQVTVFEKNNKKYFPLKGAPSNGATGENEGDEVVEGEDTMKNLRKTFAGIFGDM